MPYVAGMLKRIDPAQATFITCCVDSTEQEALEYIRERKLEFPVYMEDSGVLGQSYYELGWPTTFVLNANGEYVGYSDSSGNDYYNELLHLIEKAKHKE